MLELRDIYYEVHDDDEARDVNILRGVNLKIEDGEFMVITGPNGGGKSTIAKIIMGIIKPTSGQIFFQGEDITNLDITGRARKGIGFAFQAPVRFKGLKVYDLLKLAAGQEIDVNTACVYLSQVGLCAADYIEREINDSLSGGELKRIEIALLIARKTALSVFDEPEAGIDLWSFKNLVEVFEKQQREVNGSIVIISHQERIMEIADRIAVIADGKVKEVGAKADILPELIPGNQVCDRI
ncbi:ABC transporter ATP-binding protein [Ohessyouella blattaphilus]|uniref:ATP-binding cassette domain-containing protein n=1 Tax=Ohessyouella blattaphilus TaxID=2949333 RepID=A0ABT1EKH0_9FIRM|nr:ATP-binding cassette domain-containing protein [Ohessyouella blattaphilus]MCP1111209.1 ATP-binding cassette domain-containing protein [Ohessyouella blattaphilus]MCR8564603.1 ATP-binding cassette domain-containing protein [Ohessyouella blattaphilus]